MSTLEDRLRDALQAGAEAVEPAPDLFARVQRSVAEDRRRRRWRTRIALISGGVLAVLAALVLLTTEHRNGEAHMDWWIFEVLVTGVLIAIAVILGPFIKRFGRSYAAEVFRSNPTTGKSFIVLTDVAYYLIFSAYILFTAAVRSAARLGRHRHRGAGAVRLGAHRRDPPDHRRAARDQPADPADHRPTPHAQPAARPADEGSGGTR